MSVNWDSMILTDDRGLTVDFFVDLLQSYKNVGLMLSGGPDSAFVLYWLAKCIHENNLDNTITLMTGWELNAKWQPRLQVGQIVNFVKNKFPNNNVVNHYTWEYPASITNKDLYENYKRDLIASGDIDHYINGLTAAPLFENVWLGPIISFNRKAADRDGMVAKKRGPFHKVDKKFISFQYHKHGLMNTLFPMTNSCVQPVDDRGTPCKQCGWCLERYWAFGIYDDGTSTPVVNFTTVEEAEIKYMRGETPSEFAAMLLSEGE